MDSKNNRNSAAAFGILAYADQEVLDLGPELFALKRINNDTGEEIKRINNDTGEEIIFAVNVTAGTDKLNGVLKGIDQLTG